jgi:hypothetical protein
MTVNLPVMLAGGTNVFRSQNAPSTMTSGGPSPVLS